MQAGFSLGGLPRLMAEDNQVAGTDSSNWGVGEFAMRRRRARLARAIIVVASISLAIGVATAFYQSRTKEPWRAMIVRGDPVEVRFLCGTATVVGCGVSVKLTYQKQDAKWCERLDFSDHRVSPEKSWCNADPEHGTISILGVVHEFDGFGAVRVDDHLVGQLFAG